MVLQLSHFGISYLTCCEFASDFTCCLASSRSNLSVGNYWLKTLFDLEWPILKCLHSGKECQVAYAKLILTCNAMENLDVLYKILLLMCQWWNTEYRGLFLMKIHPVERKLYQIINGGDYCIGLWWVLLDHKRTAKLISPLCNYSLSAINRLIAYLI